MIVPREPPPGDDSTAPWWRATEHRRLLLQRCVACGAVQHPPRSVCTSCGSDQVGWMPSSGTGVVDSWTVVHRAAAPGLTPPYVVARVRLDDGPLLLTDLVDAEPTSWRCGATVRVSWRALADGRHLPVFVPREI